MKKVVCAQCGLVNLDKFVSFPHCAACGALLAQPEKPARWSGKWRRPVRPFYWMLAVGSGLAMLALAIANLAAESRNSGDKPLLVYAQIPRDLRVGKMATAQFTLDSALKEADDKFKNVSLRLSQQTQSHVVVVSVQPPPDATEMRGHGRYYGWDELPRGSVIKIIFMPGKAEKNGAVLPLQLTFWAAQYRQFEVRAAIETTAPSSSKSAVAPMQRAPKMGK